MVEEPQELSNDEILAQVRGRDARVAAVVDAIDIQGELRNSRALAMVLEQLTRDSTQAMNEFAFVNPDDRRAVMGLQARVYSIVYLDQVLRNIQQKGQLAEQDLRAEDG